MRSKGERVTQIAKWIVPIVSGAKMSTAKAPPELKDLITAQKTAEAAMAIWESGEIADRLLQAIDLKTFLDAVEKAIRDAIRTRAQAAINEVTGDIQRMWTILHPDEAIEQVRLHVPDDADKAVDVHLKFYGVDQESPRLTLSEGYRNSLGLCIFLAVAKRGANAGQSLFLDDVVVSLDREHRGMIATLLQSEFDAQQVIVFTHERDWYAELSHHLDGAQWNFVALLPYETPQTGIRVLDKGTEFGDARAQLKTRPDAAANDARKTMDIDLPYEAEKLQLRLPFVRGERNDRRMAHEFLVRLVADGGKKFRRREPDNTYKPNKEAIALWEAADALLVTWGNKGSHTKDVTPQEAAKLIDACEAALKAFKCVKCGKSVWWATTASGDRQCGCGELQWAKS